MMFVNVSCILPIHTRSVYSDSIGVRGVNFYIWYVNIF